MQTSPPISALSLSRSLHCNSDSYSQRRQARHHSGNHSGIPELPSGKRTKSYWKLPLIVDLPKKNSMVIFHSYVSLPQAKMYQTQFGGIPKAAKPAFRGNLSGAIAL